MNTDRKEPIWIYGLFFLGLSLIITFPVLNDPTNLVIGDYRSDIWDHLWGHYRTEASLSEKGELPLYETKINFPYGGVLYHVDLFNSLIVLPMRFFLGATLSYNLLVYLQLLFSGIATTLLALRFVNNRIAAVCAGLLFTFAPHMLTFTLASGVANRLNIGWIPLFFLCFHQLYVTGKLKYALFCGAAFFCAAIGCWHYAFFIFMITVPVSLWLVAAPLWTKWKYKQEVLLKPFYQSLIIKRLLPVALLCALGALPISQSASGSISTGSSGIYQREHFTFWDGEAKLELINDFSVLDLFLPFRMGLLTSYNYDLLYETTYIGYALLCLALIGIWSKNPLKWLLAALSISFVILSFGTDIFWHKSSTPTPNLFFYLCARFVPYMTAQEVPWEYIIPATFCMSILAASGVELLLSKIQSKGWQKVVGVEFILLISLELFFIAPTIVPVPVASTKVPSIYYDLAEDKEDYAIFDYPTRRDKTAMIPTEYFFYQSIHNKGIPYAIKDSWIDMNELWSQMTRLQQSGSSNIDKAMLNYSKNQQYRAFEVFSKHNYRYIIVHKQFLNAQSLKETKIFFTSHLGEPLFEDNDIVQFSLILQ